MRGNRANIYYKALERLQSFKKVSFLTVSVRSSPDEKRLSSRNVGISNMYVLSVGISNMYVLDQDTAITRKPFDIFEHFPLLVEWHVHENRTNLDPFE